MMGICLIKSFIYLSDLGCGGHLELIVTLLFKAYARSATD